jgi:uncharacterized membrane protein YvbJ
VVYAERFEAVQQCFRSFQPVFTYFETGLSEEFSQPEVAQTTRFQPDKKRILLWAGGIAASVLLLLSIRFFQVGGTQNFDPYEGSYIIRNGVRITDPEIIRPEIEKTLQLATLQQAEYEQLIREANQPEDPYVQIMQEIEKQKDDLLNQFEDETIRKEVMKIINKQL